MERYLIWYRLWLKAYLKRKTYWLQVLGMVLLLALLSAVSVPDSENTVVGVCYGQGGMAEQIAGQLTEGESVFTFRTYGQEEDLYRDVMSGRVECGFLFGGDFDAGVKNGDLKETIVYICTPFTAKGEVARETVYAALIRSYGGELLKKAEQEMFGEAVAERTEALLERNRLLREGETVFRLDMQTVDNGYRENAARTQAYPIQGMAGVFVFLMMFLAYGRKFDSGGRSVEKALAERERLIYGCIGIVAAGTLPAVAGSGMILFLTGTGMAAKVAKEILLMLLLVLLSAVWIMAAGSLMRNEASFVAGIAAVTVAAILVCPVFVDWGAYIPALRYVRCVFPVGIYLHMHKLVSYIWL